MKWSQVTSPTALAVNFEQVRQHLRLTTTKEDQLLKVYIGAATDLVERYTRRVLIRKDYLFVEDEFPVESCIDLPLSPLASVATVKYIDSTGTLTTWDSSNYEVDSTGLLGRVVKKYDSVWPATKTGVPNAMQITATVGYGTSDTAVPFGLQGAVMYLAAQFFENRTPLDIVGEPGSNLVSEVPYTLRYVLDGYRIVNV